MRRFVRSGRPIALAAALLAAAGCDTFEPRKPVISTGEGSQWERPISPEIIVQNLEIAFESGIFNDYQRAMTEDFAFMPDDADRSDMDTSVRPGEEIYVDWTREVESVTAEAIALSADSLDVTFDFYTEDSEADGLRRQKYHYDLVLYSGGEETHYLGDAFFGISRQPNGEWFIKEWEDVRTTEGVNTWGYLKGLSRQ
jgi:hypothetical protein